MASLKRILPRSLFGRAALILIVPIVTIQLVVSMAFIQRHYEGVTRQMTRAVAAELSMILAEIGAGPQAGAGLDRARTLAGRLQIELTSPLGPLAPEADRSRLLDVSGRTIVSTLHELVPELIAVDVTDPERTVRMTLATSAGPVQADVSRIRMAATNPHQLLVLMLFTSILMTAVAYLFLRNQLRPITRLAEAAEAFGRGERLIYRPRGATEVRAAGRAFLDMRARIDRQIEQRTLMLSGVSHDLRTPLTRMRLSLSLLPEDEETRALQGDVAQMERLVDEFLSFVRGDATEGEQETDLRAVAEGVVAAARRGGGEVALLPATGPERRVRLRPQAVARALENLVGNALRHGTRAEVGLVFLDGRVALTVEDDGPGIPPDRRDEALRPFTRLQAERDPNRGGGVGLGLSIAADIALSHGGGLQLGDGARLGGLLARLDLAR